MARRDFNSAWYGAGLAGRVHDQEQIRKQLDRDRRWKATDDLCTAAENNDRDSIPSLAMRTNINEAGAKGITPLQAAFNGTVEPETVQLLLDRGADVNAQGRDGSTALHQAVAVGNGAEGARMLLDNGADPNRQNVSGRTPLHLSAGATSDSGCTLALLEAGGNPNITDKEGKTPLHGARGESVDHLLDYGANPNAQNQEGKTPLHDMAFGGRESETRTLVERGADVNVRDLRGNTPLHAAAMGTMPVPEIGECLVRAGADVQAMNKDGHTAMQIADQMGRVQFKNAIKSAIVDVERQALTQTMAHDAPTEAPVIRARRRM